MAMKDIKDAEIQLTGINESNRGYFRENMPSEAYFAVGKEHYYGSSGMLMGQHPEKLQV